MRGIVSYVESPYFKLHYNVDCKKSFRPETGSLEV